MSLVKAVSAALCLIPALAAQGTLADYQRAEDLPSKARGLVVNIPGPVTWVWYGNTNHFWYSRSVKGGTEYIVVDAVTGEKKLAFDHDRLAASISTALGQKCTGLHLPFPTTRTATTSPVYFYDSERQIQFGLGGFTYTCDLRSYACVKGMSLPPLPNAARAPAGPEGPGGDPADGLEYPAPDSTPSAWQRPVIRCRSDPAHKDACASFDGQWLAVIRDHNVFLTNLKTLAPPFALSTDGSDGNYYTLESLAWSPDSRKLAACHTRPGYNREVHFIESSPADQIQPKYRALAYRKPGDALDIASPVLFDVASRKEIAIDRALFPNPYSITEPVWWKDSRAFTFEYNQRGHQLYRVIEVDAETGTARPLIGEESPTFLYYNRLGPGNSAGRRFRYDVNDGKEIIWASERDGWEHLYLYDGVTGKVKNQITKGNWLVRNVDFVDKEKRQVWFEAGGMNPKQDPYFIQYYRINFDGSGLTALTGADGTHTVEFSPDRKYYVDTWQRVDLPPVAQLRHTADQKVVMDLERGDASAWLDAGFRYPEVFVAKGRDGKTDIWGLITRPTNFDPAKKYPVIEDIYAGPQGNFVRKTFSAISTDQMIAELGFIVVRIDGMGTSNRSKAFHDVAWKNLGDAGLPDRILWHKAVAAKYPYYDISRVGIFGTSAGGQSSLGALLFHPEFYKVAVSNSGCHDNRMDKIWWNEQWMGWPVGPQYAASSNVDNAYKLQGKLLIIAGEMDTNVDPSSSLQVVNALVKAHRHFDMLYIPGQNHGVPILEPEHYRDDYFVRNLLGVEPPDWNRIPPRTEPLDCAHESAIRSKFVLAQMDMRFENQTSSVRKVYWLDFNGDRVLYQTIQPGGNHHVGTYVDHLWVVTDADDSCLAVYRANPQEAFISIRK